MNNESSKSQKSSKHIYSFFFGSKSFPSLLLGRMFNSRAGDSDVCSYAQFKRVKYTANGDLNVD